MWQQMQDGSVVRHPDGYLTLHNTPYPEPLILAVFCMNNNQPPFPPFRTIQQHGKNSHLKETPQERRRKCAEFRYRQFLQRRAEWEQNQPGRKAQLNVSIELRKQVAITQSLRSGGGKENARKRTIVNAELNCPLETCPKKIQKVKQEKKLQKRFYKNEHPIHKLYKRLPGYVSNAGTSDDNESIVSVISNLSERRSRSPLVVHDENGKWREKFLN